VRESWTSTLCHDCWKLAAGLRLVGESNRCSTRLRIARLFCTWRGILRILRGYEPIATKVQIVPGWEEVSMSSRSRVLEISYVIWNPEDSETIGLMLSPLKIGKWSCWDWHGDEIQMLKKKLDGKWFTIHKNGIIARFCWCYHSQSYKVATSRTLKLVKMGNWS
jgi:hypothetical protein